MSAMRGVAITLLAVMAHADPTVLKGRTPIAALKDWQRQSPELFSKRVYNHAGCDS